MKYNMTNSEARTFGDCAYLAIATHYQTMLSHEAGVLGDRDPEELHQMRVSMRRLRTTLVGFAPALNWPKAAREKKVGQVARVLGTLRDIDVLEETLETQYRPNLPKVERKELEGVLKILAKERQQAFAEVKEILAGKTYQQLKKGFESWLEKPQYTFVARVPIAIILPDLLLPQLSEFFLHSGWWVGMNDEETMVPEKSFDPDTVRRILAQQGERLHDLRKEAKRTRYQMELFEQFYGEEYGAYLKDAKKIQGILGEIQDSYVLLDFLHRALQAPLKTHLPTLAKQVKKVRFQKWNSWQEFQHRFLQPQTRGSLRAIAQQPNMLSLEKSPIPENPDSVAEVAESAAG